MSRQGDGAGLLEALKAVGQRAAEVGKTTDHPYTLPEDAAPSADGLKIILSSKDSKYPKAENLDKLTFIRLPHAVACGVASSIDEDDDRPKSWVASWIQQHNYVKKIDADKDQFDIMDSQKRENPLHFLQYYSLTVNQLGYVFRGILNDFNLKKTLLDQSHNEYKVMDLFKTACRQPRFAEMMHTEGYTVWKVSPNDATFTTLLKWKQPELGLEILRAVPDLVITAEDVTLARKYCPDAIVKDLCNLALSNPSNRLRVDVPKEDFTELESKKGIRKVKGADKREGLNDVRGMCNEALTEGKRKQ